MADRGDDRGDDQDDDFWDDEPESRRARKTSGPVIPIVAGAAALLLIVVIFVVARNASDSDQESQGPEATAGGNGAASGGDTVTPTSAASGGDTVTPTSAPREVARWRANVVGSPEGLTGPPPDDLAAGVYFWVDYRGWHLRAVQGQGVEQVTGTVTATDELRVTNVDAEGGAATANAEAITFDLPVGGDRVTGFDFGTGFYADEVTVTVNAGGGGALPSELVRTGGGATPAAGNPLTFQKSLSTTTTTPG